MPWDNTTYLKIEHYSDHPEVVAAAQLLTTAYFTGKQRKKDEAKMLRDAKKLVASLWIRDKDMFRFTTKTEAFSGGKSRQVWMTNRTLKLFKTAEALGWFSVAATAMSPRPDKGFKGRTAIYCRSLKFKQLQRSLTADQIDINPDLPRVELRNKRKQLCEMPRWYLESPAHARTVAMLEAHRKLILASKPELDGKVLEVGQYYYVRKFNTDPRDPQNFLGGRFYAPFTNWSKADRLRLKLGGEPVGSLDLSQLHPALLLRFLHKTDRELPGMLLEAQPEVYSMPDYEYLPRSVHKKLINTMINAQTMDSAVRALQTATYWFDEEDGEWVCKTYSGKQKREGQKVFPENPAQEARDYIARFGSRHPLMVPAVASGHGLALQKLDSELIENVLLMSNAIGVPILPVHDELILPYSQKVVAEILIEKGFRATFGEYGRFGVIKAKWSALGQRGPETIELKL